MSLANVEKILMGKIIELREEGEILTEKLASASTEGQRKVLSKKLQKTMKIIAEIESLINTAVGQIKNTAKRLNVRL
jgi:hypothetical protein